MRQMHVRPAEGRRVLLADGTDVPSAGAVVTLDTHVRACLRTGDLIAAEAVQTQPETDETRKKRGA